MNTKYYLILATVLFIGMTAPVLAKTVDGNTTFKSTIQAELQTKVDNAKANQTLRNDIHPKDVHEQGHGDMDDATTTADRERHDDRKNMRKDLFANRLHMIVTQLRLSLSNLTQIRTRIAARIDKAQATGRNMTEARTALSAADLKLTAARSAIDALASITTGGTGGTATSTASTTIDLGKPRELASVAIKAIKDARDALNLVVRAIAHNMGLGNGGTGGTGTTTGTSTTPTSSSTTP